MRLKYLGPLALDIDHPALCPDECRRYPPTCFAVEVGVEAGVHGPVIEGDVLVVNEARSVGHDDHVVIEMDEALYLYRAHRIGGRFRLLPINGGQGLMATARMVRGVVVHRARCEVDDTGSFEAFA